KAVSLPGASVSGRGPAARGAGGCGAWWRVGMGRWMVRPFVGVGWGGSLRWLPLRRRFPARLLLFFAGPARPAAPGADDPPPPPPVRLATDQPLVVADFSPDGSLLATANRKRQEPHFPDYVGPVRLWDTRTGEERACLAADWGYVGLVAFSPDSRFLAAVGH